MLAATGQWRLSSWLRPGEIVLAGLCILQVCRLNAAPLSLAERDSIELRQRQLLQQRQQLARILTSIGVSHILTGLQQRRIQPYIQQYDGTEQINNLVKQVTAKGISSRAISSAVALQPCSFLSLS